MSTPISLSRRHHGLFSRTVRRIICKANAPLSAYAALYLAGVSAGAALVAIVSMASAGPAVVTFLCVSALSAVAALLLARDARRRRPRSTAPGAVIPLPMTMHSCDATPARRAA